MNTKFTRALLPLILAASASAQVSILPGGRGNLYIGNGINLPGPAANVVISPRISLPAPLLSPTVALTLAPAPLAGTAVIPVLPVALPVALPAPSAAPAQPLIAQSVVIPGALIARFASATAKEDAPVKDKIAQREKLDNLFDGRRQPVKPGEDEFGPVRSGRHVSLPENDLEREIGAY